MSSSMASHNIEVMIDKEEIVETEEDTDNIEIKEDKSSKELKRIIGENGIKEQNKYVFIRRRNR
jgi:hypothetical protein